MRVKLSALLYDITGISDRTAAMIFSAVLEDVGLLSKTNPTIMINRMKIRRAHKKQRQLLVHKEITLLIAVFFDLVVRTKRYYIKNPKNMNTLKK